MSARQPVALTILVRLSGGCLLAGSASAVVAGEAVPPALVPPRPAAASARTHATGVQIYTCNLDHGVLHWAFKAPEAQLTGADGQPFAHHFAGPTWQAPDGSKVVGTLLAAKPSPKPDAIPWLLLSAQASGNGALTGTTYVQRVETEGGGAPMGPCPKQGQTLDVPYSATYVFFR